MVCMAEVAGNSRPAAQQAVFSSRPVVLDEAYTRKYWLTWASKYMPPGWAETRMGDIRGGHGGRSHWYYPAQEKDNGEAWYLTFRHGATGAPTKALQNAVDLGWPDALGKMAERLEEGRNPYQQDNDAAREYALRAGYACSERGALALLTVYNSGRAGLPKDHMQRGVWSLVCGLKQAEAVNRELEFPPEQYRPPEEARIIRANAALIMGQCERARNEVLERVRPRWAALTQELRTELAPLVLALEQEKLAREQARRAQLPWWQRIFN